MTITGWVTIVVTEGDRCRAARPAATKGSPCVADTGRNDAGSAAQRHLSGVLLTLLDQVDVVLDQDPLSYWHASA